MMDFNGLEAVEHELLVRVHYVHYLDGWRLVHLAPGGSFRDIINSSDPYPTLEVCREATRWYCDRAILEIRSREAAFGHKITAELRPLDPQDATLKPVDELPVLVPKWLN